MLKAFANLPIFGRMFLAFFLAALIPDVIIALVSSAYLQALEAHGLALAQTGPFLVGTLMALLASTALVISVGYLMNLTITRPLGHLAALTQHIRQGDTTARATLVGRDEIFLVASSMNSMLDNIVRLMQETQGQRDYLQAQVEKLVNEVSGVGDGDLRIQAEVTHDALGVLADSFNYMVEQLSALVVRVKQVAQEVQSATITTHERMGHLVELADGQLRQMGHASQEVAQMARSSQQMAELAQKLDEAANFADLSAHRGREKVQQSIIGMGLIHENVLTTARNVAVLGEHSQEINEIVNVISTIASQTNRLALDAAIQAAMAGENGKGFGAVATDIRRLAERTKDQAALVTRVVKSVQEGIGIVATSMQETERDTAAGAKLVGETGTAFEEIFTIVEQQAQGNGRINQMAQQQFQSSSTVAQMVQDVSGVTRQSSTTTREVAQNMEHLTGLLQHLLATVQAFKVRGEAEAGAYSLEGALGSRATITSGRQRWGNQGSGTTSFLE
jgi:methyl-accepting chemotaxis protein